eukprot:TRINITY_DN240_c0_g1_i9.p1 TRINITY_DN240_c0_g1~~TRINITY_DN240_c0_g1_i9.p1  ORF type:complete len:388 (+),score=43.13 TRINITY_DN240_c0_g1_i9:254-1417(+)
MQEYTIVVSNEGPSQVHLGTLTVNDTFPAILYAIEWTCTPSTILIFGNSATCNATGSADPIMKRIQDDSLVLPPGTNVTYVVTSMIASSATGQLNNTVYLNTNPINLDSNRTNNEQTDNSLILVEGDLDVFKSDYQIVAVPATAVTYEVKVVNRGPSDVHNVTVTDIFESILLNISWTCSKNGTTNCGSNNISETTISLTARSTVIYNITAQIDSTATGFLNNTVTAYHLMIDSNVTNNIATDSDQLNLESDVAIWKTNGAEQLIPGKNTTYTITIYNRGTSDISVGSITVVDYLESSVFNEGYWTCNGYFSATCTSGGPARTINVSDTMILRANSVLYMLTAFVKSLALGFVNNSVSFNLANTNYESNDLRFCFFYFFKIKLLNFK